MWILLGHLVHSFVDGGVNGNGFGNGTFYETVEQLNTKIISYGKDIKHKKRKGRTS